METGAAARMVSQRAQEEGTLRRVLGDLPVTQRHLDVAGIPTALLEGGDGRPVVLLHGAGEFAATWARVIPELTRHHHVLAPDLPGHGGSGIAQPLDREHVLTWVGELIRRTCAEPPILMGHLLGGAIAARFAAADPGALRHLVLVDSQGLAWYRPAPSFALAMVAFMARPNERTQDRLFRRCMADLDGLRADMDGRMEVLEAYALERAREPELQSALRRLMPLFGIPPIPAEELDRSTTPTTLVWGRDDLQIPLTVAKRASARHGWPLHVIDGARDDPAVEQPAAFLEALGPVLDGNGAEPEPDRVRVGWDRIAADFDRSTTPWALRLGEEALERAGVRPGMRVLDVAAGSGALSLPAARRGARVLATDISAVMLDRLLDRARAEGLAVETREMDAHALDLEDDAFDLTASQNGVSLLPDLPRGLAEMVRVTRPGGQVLVVCFGPLREAEFLTVFFSAVAAVVPGFEGLPLNPAPLPFQLADPGILHRRLEEAGLSEVRVDQTVWEMEPGSGSEFWDMVTSSNPIAAKLVAKLTPAQRAGVRRVLDDHLRQRSGSGAAGLRNSINIGTGIRE